MLNEKNNKIGWVTSGTMSVSLSRGICLALIEREHFPENKKFKIKIRNKEVEASYHKKAFVLGGHK